MKNTVIWLWVSDKNYLKNSLEMCEAHLGNASSVLYRLGIPSMVHGPATSASSDNLVDMQKTHSPHQAKQITISLTISAGASYTN